MPSPSKIIKISLWGVSVGRDGSTCRVSHPTLTAKSGGKPVLQQTEGSELLV